MKLTCTAWVGSLDKCTDITMYRFMDNKIGYIRNIVARSRNHCRSGNATMYSVFFSTFSHKRHMFEKINY